MVVNVLRALSLGTGATLAAAASDVISSSTHVPLGGAVAVGLARLKLSWFSGRLAVLMGGYLLAEWMFGSVTELRSWLCLVPFVLFVYLWSGEKQRQPLATCC